MYIIKNLFITIIGIIFCIFIIVINNYLQIIKLNYEDILLLNYFNDNTNLFITIIIFTIIYFFTSLVNYLITNKTFTNYYCFIIALIVGALHGYCINYTNSSFNLTLLIYIISLHVFLSFFVNYSTKYK